MTKIIYASILAVGTEITTGQIINCNASWISQKLEELGVTTVLHETIPDDRPLIFSALERCASLSDIIFISGGLGPTSDDFTREVIAEWLGEPLQYSEPAWQTIVKRLTQFGVSIANSNQQQCFFPNSAEILPNPEGTAAGFTCAIKRFPGKTLWALPGPPREIAAIWNIHETGSIQNIPTRIQKLYPKKNPLKLFTWQCLGKSEAELGEITEQTIKDSGLITGYRYHFPFVEIKIWCPEAEIKEKSPWIEKIEKAISPWLYSKEGEDLAHTFLLQLEPFSSIEICDFATGGYLTHRLSLLLKKAEWSHLREKISLITQWKSSERSPLLTDSNCDLSLSISGFSDDFEGVIQMKKGIQTFEEKFESPYRKKELIERTQAYAAELALKKWGKLLIPPYSST